MGGGAPYDTSGGGLTARNGIVGDSLDTDGVTNTIGAFGSGSTPDPIFRHAFNESPATARGKGLPPPSRFRVTDDARRSAPAVAPPTFSLRSSSAIVAGWPRLCLSLTCIWTKTGRRSPICS
ncbi:hypothetical protein ACFJIW_01325 [Tahibacter sp. UC22_41]|uniref:hypothetical protein n=1 Tax=Tahibacter sp. UC22_41 TaxID=3350178 RepID=UPI0036DBC7FA